MDFSEAEEEDLFGGEDNENEENDRKLTEIESDMLMLHRSMSDMTSSAEQIAEKKQDKGQKPSAALTFADIVEEDSEEDSSDGEERKDPGAGLGLLGEPMNSEDVSSFYQEDEGEKD